MKKLILVLTGLMLLGTSCEKDAITPADCLSLAGATILSEEEKAAECIYSSVYRYKGKIYTTLNCCVCDLVYMAYDCNGTPLCALDQNCMEDFAAKAEYLYAIMSE